MKKILIYFIDSEKIKNNFKIVDLDDSVGARVNIYNLNNYKLEKMLSKINNLVSMYNEITNISISFEKSIKNINTIIVKLNDILYNYKTIKSINFDNIENEGISIMKELNIYKDIVMDPNKNPDTYLDYIKKNVPQNYDTYIYKLSDNNFFPLTYAVGKGSIYSSYFVYIFPKNINPNNKDLFLIGKGVTFDSGGLNIKTKEMDEMKIDMTGSAIMLSVVKLLSQNNNDKKCNIHLLIPIAENMIGNNALRPGYVLKTMNNKTIEVVNTDAEGRLCLVDGIEYVNSKLLKKDNSLIIDIATLTGNTLHITSGISSLLMGNDKANKYINELINIGEKIGEYVDYLKIRNEYLDSLDSKVADIKNINTKIKSDCVLAGTFLNYFTTDKVPWIHIDVGVSTYIDSIPKSYGIYLLYEFIRKL